MIRQTIDLFRKEQTMNSPDFEIFNYSDSVAPKVLPHRHNFFEIYYLLSDELDYVIGNQEYHLKRGDFLLLPPGLLHYPSDMHIRPGKNYSRIVLWCNIDFFENFLKLDSDINYMWDTVIQKSSYHIRPTPGASSRLYDYFLQLLNEQKQQDFASRAMSCSVLMESFVLMNRIIHETKDFQKHAPSANTFSNIISYVHTHLSEELSLTILSEHFYISKGYISRLFREYMGIPVHQYILSLRLEGSRKAIQSGAPILTAAEMYGFRDYSSFYRAFKGAFLISPREYQEKEACAYCSGVSSIPDST